MSYIETKVMQKLKTISLSSKLQTGVFKYRTVIFFLSLKLPVLHELPNSIKQLWVQQNPHAVMLCLQHILTSVAKPPPPPEAGISAHSLSASNPSQCHFPHPKQLLPTESILFYTVTIQLHSALPLLRKMTVSLPPTTEFTM